MAAGKNKCAEVRKAFEECLEILGTQSRESLLNHLKREFDVSVEDEGCSEVSEIESALQTIFGQGASLLVTEFRKRLGPQDKGRRQASRR